MTNRHDPKNERTKLFSQGCQRTWDNPHHTTAGIEQTTLVLPCLPNKRAYFDDDHYEYGMANNKRTLDPLAVRSLGTGSISIPLDTTRVF